MEGCQDAVMLKGKVWLDETYVGADKSERIAKSGGKRLRGISGNQICIGVATDGASVLIAVEGRGKPSKRRTLATFKDHIEPGSTLVHDGDNSHSSLVMRLRLVSEVHETSETKGLADCDNPLDPVNDVHSRIMDFLDSHVGGTRANLQDWLNLFWLIWSPPENRYRKIQRFLEMAINHRKVLMSI